MLEAGGNSRSRLAIRYGDSRKETDSLVVEIESQRSTIRKL
jgi:hypothetical protein